MHNSSTRDFSAPLVGLSAVGRLEQSQAFLVRVADVERAYRALLRSSVGAVQLERSVDRFQFALRRACEAYLNGSSQAVRQDFKWGLP